MKTHVLCALAGAVILTASAAKAVVVNFNGGAQDLTNNFNCDFDGNPVASNPTFSDTAGVSDNGGMPGGGLVGNNTDVTCVYTGAGGAASPASFDLTTGQSVSLFFQSAAPGTNRIVQVGFINQVNSSFNNDAGKTPPNTAFITARPYGTGQVEFQIKDATDGTHNTTLAPAGTALTPNNWYKITLAVQELDTTANTFAYNVSLDNYGADGVSSPVNVFTSGPKTATIAGGAAAFGSGVGYPGFRQISASPNMDNFEAAPGQVPEPASLGLMGLLAAGLLRRRSA